MAWPKASAFGASAMQPSMAAWRSAASTSRTMVPTGARTLFRRFLVHHRLGARRVDDALGEAVHLLDLGARAVGGRGSLQGSMLLGHDAAAHLGGERVQPVIGLREGAAQRGDAVAAPHDRICVLDEARGTAPV